MQRLTISVYYQYQAHGLSQHDNLSGRTHPLSRPASTDAAAFVSLYLHKALLTSALDSLWLTYYIPWSIGYQPEASRRKQHVGQSAR